jgi:hypothetical protein
MSNPLCHATDEMNANQSITRSRRAPVSSSRASANADVGPGENPEPVGANATYCGLIEDKTDENSAAHSPDNHNS